jgi:DNA-binding LacI/PurR family transcriptional regulator
VNLRDIAARAGVSTATVSRALNRVPTVDPSLARRVWEVVDEFHYYPNTQARALVLGSSRIFGLIIEEVTNPFFAEVVQAFEQIAVQKQYEILLCSIGFDPGRTELIVRRMIERRVDGVAILTFGIQERLVEAFRIKNIPLVIADAGQQFAGTIGIKIDYLHGIQQAVRHLAALRHSRIGLVTGPSHTSSAVLQKDAFEDSMHEIGLDIPSEFIVVGNLTTECGRTALRKLMATSNRPTAVLCSNNLTAIGLLAEARERGIQVPQGLSVVGVEDIDLSRFTVPPLTTIGISRLELAERAFTALVREAQDRGRMATGFEYLLRPNLVVRQSTGLAP